eukprot:TRINITY_DN10056_c0_g1_i1.p1 TRINITY_DN10056_c0_g1~~TRINITY_DN10056_c0_g1_i1.p1  ORF type:complete len:241 (-),score=46.45 TRINITY_DN10056_c0_g1_i1:399-1121(-)
MAEHLEKEAMQNVNEKGFIPDELRNSIFRKLRMQNANRSCFECPNRNPTWNSLTYGIYLCLECSGEHRRKGVHISFVRSVELDSFTPTQMVQMAVGGNGKALEFFKSNEMGKTSSSGRPVDYNSKVAQRYKAQMEAESQQLCAQLGITGKSASSSPSASPTAKDEDSTPRANGNGKVDHLAQACAEFDALGFDSKAKKWKRRLCISTFGSSCSSSKQRQLSSCYNDASAKTCWSNKRGRS